MKNVTTNTLFIGKVLKSLSEVDSTNNYAKNIISKSNPIEGTAICADYQLQGRGQIGSKWMSDRGKNIILSLILFPDFLQAKQQFIINQLFSLSIVSALEELFGAGKFSLKWPNDIYYKHKKVGGILIENSLQGNNIKHCVLGLGLNVNQTDFSDAIPNPISLKLIQGLDIEREIVLAKIFESIEHRYLKLRSCKKNIFQDEYLNQLIGYNEEIKLREPGNQAFNGLINDLDEMGRINVINIDEQSEKRYSFKEIEFVF